jgi:lactoylglutathione lyase
MTVKRIVFNIAADSTAQAASFYRDVLELDCIMDLGWVQTFGCDSSTTPQLSVASEGGSGAAVPDVSIEVDNFDDIYRRCLENGFKIEYGPTDEPWGVRRFYVRDPFNRLVNILTHV